MFPLSLSLPPFPFPLRCVPPLSLLLVAPPVCFPGRRCTLNSYLELPKMASGASALAVPCVQLRDLWALPISSKPAGLSSQSLDCEGLRVLGALSYPFSIVSSTKR